MTRLVSYAVAASLLLALSGPGCAGRSGLMMKYPHARAATLGRSPHEHYHYVARIADQDQRALIEDLDLLFMTDRPTRLARWHTP